LYFTSRLFDAPWAGNPVKASNSNCAAQIRLRWGDRAFIKTSNVQRLFFPASTSFVLSNDKMPGQALRLAGG